ncbi:hypothetical protein CVV67_12180 [Arthrobacter stackebrandtii]|nr:hypothetical protein CVV67_12180 [Arthrobacter stackebrandtii]
MHGTEAAGQGKPAHGEGSGVVLHATGKGEQQRGAAAAGIAPQDGQSAVEVEGQRAVDGAAACGQCQLAGVDLRVL